MGHFADQFMVYTCDNCGTELQVDGVMGGPLGGPVNWKSVIPQTTSDGDWFCGYKCLAEWALNMQAKMDARKASRLVTANGETNGSSEVSETGSDTTPVGAESQS